MTLSGLCAHLLDRVGFLIYVAAAMSLTSRDATVQICRDWWGALNRLTWKGKLGIVVLGLLVDACGRFIGKQP